MAKFGLQINGIGFSEAAYKISAQFDFIQLSYRQVWFGLARFVLAKFGAQINGVGFSEAACKILT